MNLRKLKIASDHKEYEGNDPYDGFHGDDEIKNFKNEFEMGKDDEFEEKILLSKIEQARKIIERGTDIYEIIEGLKPVYESISRDTSSNRLEYIEDFKELVRGYLNTVQIKGFSSQELFTRFFEILKGTRTSSSKKRVLTSRLLSIANSGQEFEYETKVNLPINYSPDHEFSDDDREDDEKEVTIFYDWNEEDGVYNVEVVDNDQKVYKDYNLGPILEEKLSDRAHFEREERKSNPRNFKTDTSLSVKKSTNLRSLRKPNK